jgi:hypothetical protein
MRPGKDKLINIEQDSMDIRVNDDTIPKKTINMKLKRKYPQGRLISRREQYVRKKSHGRKIWDRREARWPTQKWKQ